MGRPDSRRKGWEYDVQGGGSVSLPRQYRGTTVGGRGREGISRMVNGKPSVSAEGTRGGTGANCGTAVRRGGFSSLEPKVVLRAAFGFGLGGFLEGLVQGGGRVRNIASPLPLGQLGSFGF